MIIARTKEKESASEDGVLWWKEWRLIQDCFDQWCLQLRYMSRVDDKVYARVNGKTALFTDPETTWQTYMTGDNPAKVVDEFMGDGDFYKAESLDLIHARAKAATKAVREYNERLYKAKMRAEDAKSSYAEWNREQRLAFEKRHKDKEGDAYAKALTRTRKRLMPERDRFLAEIDAAEQELKTLEGSVAHE